MFWLKVSLIYKKDNFTNSQTNKKIPSERRIVNITRTAVAVRRARTTEHEGVKRFRANPQELSGHEKEARR